MTAQGCSQVGDEGDSLTCFYARSAPTGEGASSVGNAQPATCQVQPLRGGKIPAGKPAWPAPRVPERCCRGQSLRPQVKAPLGEAACGEPAVTGRVCHLLGRWGVPIYSLTHHSFTNSLNGKTESWSWNGPCGLATPRRRRCGHTHAHAHAPHGLTFSSSCRSCFVRASREHMVCWGATTVQIHLPSLSWAELYTCQLSSGLVGNTWAGAGGGETVRHQVGHGEDCPRQPRGKADRNDLKMF